MKVRSHFLDNAWVYRIWQAPYAERKLRPMLKHNDLSAIKRVLDVGCGPGTNAPHFDHADYLGIDINPEYVAWASRRYGDRFIVGDVCDSLPAIGGRFDFILVNSFLHHVDTPDARQILSRLASLLTPGGHVHILELVMPPRLSVARVLARADRGDFPRPVGDWRTLFGEFFEPVVFEPYPLGALGVALWQMVYFKGRRRA